MCNFILYLKFACPFDVIKKMSRNRQICCCKFDLASAKQPIEERTPHHFFIYIFLLRRDWTERCFSKTNLSKDPKKAHKRMVNGKWLYVKATFCCHTYTYHVYPFHWSMQCLRQFFFECFVLFWVYLCIYKCGDARFFAENLRTKSNIHELYIYIKKNDFVREYKFLNHRPLDSCLLSFVPTIYSAQMWKNNNNSKNESVSKYANTVFCVRKCISIDVSIVLPEPIPPRINLLELRRFTWYRAHRQMKIYAVPIHTFYVWKFFLAFFVCLLLL